MLTYGGRALDGLGPIPGYQNQSNSEYSNSVLAVRLWVITFMVERETTQIAG